MALSPRRDSTWRIIGDWHTTRTCYKTRYPPPGAIFQFERWVVPPETVRDEQAEVCREYEIAA